MTAASRRDLYAVLALLGLVVLFLAPALVDGTVFAPADVANQLSGLTAGLSSGVHNHLTGDLATQMLPWNTLDWRLVHAGQFPLWNGYEALGMPQFLNFESAVLSLPDLAGYLAPVEASFVVVVGVKLALAGTGTYVLLRVLGGRPVAGAAAGATFMLSGPFSGWLGWPIADVLAWSGWLAAFTVLAYRDPARLRWVALLAVAVAFSAYGGFPEANALLAGAAFVALAVFVLATLAQRRRVSLAGAAGVLAGAAAGAGLSAPLWLPGSQLLGTAARATEAGSAPLPWQELVLYLFPGWNGLPTGSSPALAGGNYYETVAYVGIPALVLAVTAALMLRRDPRVLGLVAAVLACLVAVYGLPGAAPVQDLTRLLGAGTVNVARARLVLGFLLAVLAGLGLDGAITALHPRRQQVSDRRRVPVAAALASGPAVASDAAWSRRYGDVLLGTALAAAALVGVLAVLGATRHLPAANHRDRVASLWWPCVLAAGTVVACAAVWVGTRGADLARRRLALTAGVVTVLVGGQVAYLGLAAESLTTFSGDFFPQNAATTDYVKDVGTALVGIDRGNAGDPRAWAGLGFYPNVNVGYGVRQFTVHDPVMPAGYLDWPGTTGTATSSLNLFAPAVTSAAEARAYGIGFLIASVARPAPAGTVPVETFAGARLYRVPGAAQFAFADPAGGGPRKVESVTEESDRSWRAVVSTTAGGDLVMRVTAVPGWHVTADGRPLPVRRYGQLMEQVTVPAGRHVLQIWYWPDELGLGIRLAAGVAALLAAAGLGASAFGRRARWRRPAGPAPGATSDAPPAPAPEPAPLGS